MFFSRRDKPNENNSRFNLNFDFSQIPIPNIRVPNFTQTFGNAPDSFNRFMSPLRSDRGRNSPLYCDNCETKFNIITKRKKNCLDCSMDFCSDCFIRDSPGTRFGRCKKCYIFSRYPLDRVSLMTLRVRDLRWYLARRHIPARFCKEKSELVELIIQSTSNNFQTSSGLSDHTEQENDSESTDSNWVFVNTDDDLTPTATTTSTTSSTTVINTDSDQNIQNNASVVNSNNTNDNETASTSDYSANDNQLFNISDIKSEEEIQNLTVRQMKLLLTRNFVDYKGCCEKEELLIKTTRLWKEFNQQEDPDLIKDENLCKICMEAEINCVLLECGHMVTCNNCGKKLNECPICRQYVVRVIRTFKS